MIPRKWFENDGVFFTIAISMGPYDCVKFSLNNLNFNFKTSRNKDRTNNFHKKNICSWFKIALSCIISKHEQSMDTLNVDLTAYLPGYVSDKLQQLQYNEYCNYYSSIFSAEARVGKMPAFMSKVHAGGIYRYLPAFAGIYRRLLEFTGVY